MTFASFAIRHAAVLGLIAATAWAAGRIGIRVLRLGASSVPHALTIAIGLALLAQGGLLVGWLRAPVLASIALGLQVAAIGDWRHVAATSVRAQLRQGRASTGSIWLSPPIARDSQRDHSPLVFSSDAHNWIEQFEGQSEGGFARL